MIEIEIRAKIKSLKELKDKLNSLGAEHIKTENQVDRVFGHPMQLDSETKIIEGGFSARIRQVDDTQRLQFKEILRQKGGIELTIDLSDVEHGLRFLDKIGYEEAFTVSKSRDSFLFKGFTICLDEVEKLGDFIEIEKSSDTREGEEDIRKECLSLLKELSPGSEVETKKYGDLMQELKNKGEY